MPTSVSMVLELSTDLGSPDELRTVLKRRVQAFEQRADATRRSMGQKVIGRRNLLRQSWRNAPTSFEPRRGMSPRVAATNMWQRIEALVRNLEFARAYAVARLDGLETAFPIGTYWLKRFAHVPIAA